MCWTWRDRQAFSKLWIGEKVGERLEGRGERLVENNYSALCFCFVFVFSCATYVPVYNEAFWQMQ